MWLRWSMQYKKNVNRLPPLLQNKNSNNAYLPVVLGGLLVANNTLGVVLADDAVTSFLNLTRGSPGLEDVVLWHIGQLRYIMPARVRHGGSVSLWQQYVHKEVFRHAHHCLC